MPSSGTKRSGTRSPVGAVEPQAGRSGRSFQARPFPARKGLHPGKSGRSCFWSRAAGRAEVVKWHVAG